MTANTYGGAVKRSVSTSLYFRVATTVLETVRIYGRLRSSRYSREEVRNRSRSNDSKEKDHQNISLNI
jgi:hypothetical protein